MRVLMWMGATIDDAMAFMRTTEFAMTLFTGVETDQAVAGWAAVAEALTHHTGPRCLELQSHAWLVTATKP